MITPINNISGYIAQENARIIFYRISEESGELLTSLIYQETNSSVDALLYLPSQRLLLVAISGAYSRLISISKDRSIETIADDVASKIGRNAIKTDVSETNIYLNSKGTNIRVFTNLKNGVPSGEVPINMANGVIDFVPYEQNKVVVVSKDNRLRVVKFASFGYNEVVAEVKNIPANGTDRLNNISICKHQKYLVVSTTKSQSSLFTGILIMIIRKDSRLTVEEGGYKIDIFKKYELSSTSPITEMFISSICGYLKESNSAVLTAVEINDSTSTKVYFHSFNDDNLKKEFGTSNFEGGEISDYRDTQNCCGMLLNREGNLYSIIIDN